jgi:glycosyltransferase involved in cell wall biosynthesis
MSMPIPPLPVSPEKAKLSVIFSFRNEEQNLPEAISRLGVILKQEIQDRHLGDYELVFIDDDSSDRSQEILNQAGQADPRIKVVRMARNFGHDVCALAGFELCTGDLAVYLDADLQDPPELIPEMLKIWREKNTDVLHTVRTSREGEPAFKMAITKLGYAILRRFSSVRLESNCGDFKLISRRAIKEMVKFREVNPFLRGIATYVGFRQEKLNYVRKPRFAGTSSMPVLGGRVVNFFLDSALISFSDVPLKLVTLAGFIISYCSFLMVVYVLVEKYLGHTVPGWSGIMIVVSLLGGIQLVSMGVIGLYLNSIFLEVKRRPQYIIENKLNL